MTIDLDNLKSSLPYFPGFYYSSLDTNFDNWEDDFEEVFKGKADEDVYSLLHKEMEDNRWDYFNTEKRELDICKNWTDGFESKLHEFYPDLCGIEIEFVGMTHPREYNFTTDSCDVKFLGVTPEVLAKICEILSDNEEKVSEWIKEEWSDRDGFWSFMSNDFETWLKILELNEDTIKELEIGDNRFADYLSCTLGYLLMLEDEEFIYDLEEEGLYLIYDMNYVDNDALLNKFGLCWNETMDKVIWKNN